MTRLIDADALKEKFKDRSLEDFTHLHFIDAIDNAPTVECTWIISGKRYGKKEEALKYLRPHGEWIKEDKPYENDFVLVNTCSICGESFIYHGTNANFCPNCGADMREADNDK